MFKTNPAVLGRVVWAVYVKKLCVRLLDIDDGIEYIQLYSKEDIKIILGAPVITAQLPDAKGSISVKNNIAFIVYSNGHNHTGSIATDYNDLFKQLTSGLNDDELMGEVD